MQPTGPERFRIAVVQGSRQGSGYLLTSRLVLTAGHLVTNRYQVKVAALGGVGEIECRVLWARHDRECDAALLFAKKGGLLPRERADELDTAPVRRGRPLGLETMESCQAIGFPRMQRDGEELDTEQIVGTFKPGSRMVHARYVLDSPHTPPAPLQGGESPWAGMSGAALFAEGHIIGVVVADPHGWQHGRLEAVRSRVLFDDAKFVQELVKHTGHEPTIAEFSGTEEHNPHAEFERRYAAQVAERFNELTIFGLDFSRQDPHRVAFTLTPRHAGTGCGVEIGNDCFELDQPAVLGLKSAQTGPVHVHGTRHAHRRPARLTDSPPAPADRPPAGIRSAPGPLRETRRRSGPRRPAPCLVRPGGQACRPLSPE
ncbi:trypsin-like peptidase domain-containing protein [Streptomyces sp. WMMB 322]|uniref:trypsin-like peptidase domain-containing protein n=1 Tax=Streptomyces sp. WMMB 322 TaxID=1286821 RepID=UPI0006E28AD7|nr:trypsin-like peptidase domain-containing protein [Streptomyces sp. WMMB 322]SCK48333.1 hypothetical protein H180DRAFT_04320 [Streptomyces sp. WMMB 322]